MYGLSSTNIDISITVKYEILSQLRELRQHFSTGVNDI